MSASATFPKTRTGWIWRIAIAVCAAFVLIAAFLVWRQTRMIRDRTVVRENLKQIGLALHAYLERTRYFPAAWTTDETGHPRQSWRTMLLPELGEAELAAAYQAADHWDAPANLELLARRPGAYATPGHEPDRPSQTRMTAVVGPQTLWPLQHPMNPDEVVDGKSMTIAVIESPTVTLEWTEPRDLTYDEAVNLKLMSPKERGRDLVHVLLADGAVRAIKLDKIHEEVWNGLLTPRGGRGPQGVTFSAEAWGETAAAVLPEPLPASEFHQTTVVALPAEPLTAGRNTVWCCTLQLAWQQIDEKSVSNVSPLARALQQHRFDPAALDPAAYLAVAEFEYGEARPRLQSQLNEKFSGVVSDLLPKATTYGGGLVMFAYLEKSLPLLSRFEKFARPLKFHTATGDTEAPAFGIEKFEVGSALHEQWSDQVDVLAYQPEGDMVVRLNSREGDQILLARIDRPETLAAGIDRVLSLAGTAKVEKLSAGDELRVPLLSLGISREYPELTGTLFGEQQIRSATQVIRFRIDESGAKLRSEAVMVADFEVIDNRPLPGHPWQLVFDRPFLLLLKERQAKQPYFAMWIEDPRLN